MAIYDWPMDQREKKDHVIYMYEMELEETGAELASLKQFATYLKEQDDACAASGSESASDEGLPRTPPSRTVRRHSLPGSSLQVSSSKTNENGSRRRASTGGLHEFTKEVQVFAMCSDDEPCAVGEDAMFEDDFDFPQVLPGSQGKQTVGWGSNKASFVDVVKEGSKKGNPRMSMPPDLDEGCARVAEDDWWTSERPDKNMRRASYGGWDGRRASLSSQWDAHTDDGRHEWAGASGQDGRRDSLASNRRDSLASNWDAQKVTPFQKKNRRLSKAEMGDERRQSLCEAVMQRALANISKEISNLLLGRWADMLGSKYELEADSEDGSSLSVRTIRPDGRVLVTTGLIKIQTHGSGGLDRVVWGNNKFELELQSWRSDGSMNSLEWICISGRGKGFAWTKDENAELSSIKEWAPDRSSAKEWKPACSSTESWKSPAAEEWLPRSDRSSTQGWKQARSSADEWKPARCATEEWKPAHSSSKEWKLPARSSAKEWHVPRSDAKSAASAELLGMLRPVAHTDGVSMGSNLLRMLHGGSAQVKDAPIETLSQATDTPAFSAWQPFVNSYPR